jgi:hypothetical protein
MSWNGILFPSTAFVDPIASAHRSSARHRSSRKRKRSPTSGKAKDRPEVVRLAQGLGPRPMNSVWQVAIDRVVGETIERKTRINRPGAGNVRCRGLEARDQPKDFSPFTPQYTTHSTSNVTSTQQEQIELSVRQPCRRGATPLRSRSANCPLESLRIATVM